MHRIVVLGAGYAGLSTVTNLVGRTRRRADVRITVVNASDRFTERLRLHQVAAGQRVAELRLPDLLADTGVEIVTGWVTGVDAAARTVRVDDERVLEYDTLVYALGGVADTAAVPGVDDHAHTLDSAHDAEVLARRLDELGTGTVAVCGGGLTGVEAAAEIAEQHPELDVVLLGRQAPGAAMGPKAMAYLRGALDRLGVRVRGGVDIVKVLPDSVELADGDGVAADVVLWTSGVRVSPLAAAAGVEVDERGRIVTDAALRSVSHPRVYAIGDAASVRQGYGVMHGTCQSGMPTGVHAARSIVRELRGKRPYQGVAPDEMAAEVVELNGGPGVVFSGGGRVLATLTLDLDDDGRITAVHNVANPDKLGAVASRAVHRVGAARGAGAGDNRPAPG